MQSTPCHAHTYYYNYSMYAISVAERRRRKLPLNNSSCVLHVLYVYNIYACTVIRRTRSGGAAVLRYNFYYNFFIHHPHPRRALCRRPVRPAPRVHLMRLPNEREPPPPFKYSRYITCLIYLHNCTSI